MTWPSPGRASTIYGLARASTRVPLAVLLVALAAASGGCAEERAAFGFLGVDPASRVLARNESFVLLFDSEPAPAMAQTPLLVVTDDRGRDVPVSLRVAGKSLIVRSADGWSWPADADRLQVELRRGYAVSFTDTEGRPLDGRVDVSLEIAPRYRDFGAPFRLADVQRPAGPMVGPGERFALRFTLPIDPASLLPPFDAVAVFGPDGLRRPCTTTLREQGRELVVTPWPAGSGLSPGAPHRLVVGPTLRALTGRLVESAYEEAFWTAPIDAEEGFLDVSFALSDLATEADGARDAAKGWARPVYSPLNAVVLNGDFTHLGRAERTTFVEPWSRWPSRVKLLLPGERLGGEPGMITGLAFFVVDAPTQPLVFPRVIFRIGRAPEGGLSASGAAPGIDEDAVETVARRSALGEWTPDAAGWAALRENAGQGWLAIDFERPYLYEGDGADLVLEIRNELGCYPAEPRQPFPLEFTGLRWAGGLDEDAAADRPFTRVVSHAAPADPAAAGEADHALLAMKIRVDRFRDHVTPWIPVEAEDPEFFVLPTSDHLDADGVEGVDFRFSFQGRHDLGPTPWGGLEALRGSRSIRVKLGFPPSSGRSAGEAVEVRSLRLRYHDYGARRRETNRGTDR